MAKITMQSVFDFFKTKGFETKEKRTGMTAEQFATFSADFKKEFEVELAEALETAAAENNEEDTRMAEIMDKAEMLLGSKKKATDEKKEDEETASEDEEEENASDDEEEKDEKKTAKKTSKKTASTNQSGLMLLAEKLIGLAEDQKQQIETLAATRENPNPKKVGAKVVMIGGGAHTDKYLFGIEAPMFERTKPWNQVAAMKRPLETLAAQGMGVKAKWADYESDFKAEVKNYGASLADRIAQLQDGNQLQSLTLAEMDFTGFDNTGWGEQYIVRRQDALIAYLRTLPSVTSIFPVRYGVQDKMVMTNSFLTDFSSAWQSGKVWKGGYSVEPVMAEVFDVMMKHKFENMKQLEREYIGYLNREGSFPIKWSMVEWLMAQILTKLLNEQNERRIRGRRINPTTGTAGHHMFASNGLIYQLLFKYTADGFLQKSTAYKTYTSSTIVAYVEGWVEELNQALPSLQGLTMYINEKHIPWYLKNYESTYGLKLDYDGAKLTVKHYPFDSIVGVPNMGNSCFMFITMPGNVEFYELQAGEMAGVYFQQDLDELLTMSTWKEGVGAYMIGKKNGTALTDQYIFINDPVTELAAGATAANANVNTYFRTVANVAATEFLDFTNKQAGVVYRLECGNATNATATTKALLFSNVKAWTPTAVGDFLEVYWDATASKYVEVGRKVTA